MMIQRLRFDTIICFYLLNMINGLDHDVGTNMCEKQHYNSAFFVRRCGSVSPI